MTALKPVSSLDLKAILDSSHESLSYFGKKKWLLTGCTGFFGQWLTQLLVAAQKKGICKPQVVLLTRNKSIALKNNPWLDQAPFVEWTEGDIRSPLPSHIDFEGVIHGATSASTTFNTGHPEEMFNTIVEGTRSMLGEAKTRGATDFMFISSGGVYGIQPPELTHLPENFNGASDPLTPGSAYGIGKRAAEFLCAEWARTTNNRALIVRCFAFLGPYLPLDTHFAAGNFMNDVLHNRDIEIKGDGLPYRSYLYGTDLITWLLRILSHGQNSIPYHVGSEEDIQLKDLAELILKTAISLGISSDTKIKIATPPNPAAKPPRYVPSTLRTRTALNLKETVPLKEAIQRTLLWHRG